MYLLRLVNQNDPLSSYFIPQQLVRDPITEVWLVKEVYEMFYKLNVCLQSEGISPLVLISGYRSFEYQKNLFNKKILRLIHEGMEPNEARKIAPTIVARPGCSEHQLGLAIDITTSILAREDDPLISEFGATEQGEWLKRHSSEFGFILRYSKEKQPLTGITYEPWHYRYVGIGHAKKIVKLDVCLEEYLEYMKTHTSF